MFGKKRSNRNYLVKKRISLGHGLAIGLGILSLLLAAGLFPGRMEANSQSLDSIIRFHVLANSDSAEDQSLKYAVRDAILKQIAPRLAKSGSLEESRKIIREAEDELLTVARDVVRDWGQDYPVTIAYGKQVFPTKSYGRIVLPGGTYEAVQVKIGAAEGANWWCVLFPPLCFVNVEKSTTLPVDGKAGVPLDTVKKLDPRAEQANKSDAQASQGKKSDTQASQAKESGIHGQISEVSPAGGKEQSNPGEEKGVWSKVTYKGKKVGFFFSRFF